MAICGFNEKIGNGLSLLVEGMIDALNKKAATTTPREVIANELLELDNIISVLRIAEGEVLPEMFIGLNLMAKALFIQVQHDIETSQDKSLGDICHEVGDRFIDLLAQTELKSEEMRSQQDRSGTVAESARELARWALEYSRAQVSASPESVAIR